MAAGSSSGVGRTRQFLAPNDLAELLGVPVRTIYRWRWTGDGPRGFRVGRHVRYRAADIERWLEERRDAG
jgi:excisionase family DNA binding protein